ncbi:FecCD family ABC transporter permease [Novosphingobium panipatense]|uniref:Iron complex transport system permease protein n=1 Tax=Novosphingobium panipatense TaxID=428991 RepID=A0ABY1Q3Z0_9SPHN|nr:iron ABC transporter permease [Novosphingobium panipatense]SMP57477.1 iron complex transport system permease protein [Novosphingobium panipatense]
MRWLTPSLMVLLLLTATASTLAGTVWLSPHQAFASAFSGKADLAGLIVTEIRLPRVMLAIAIGASLGLSGAVLQGLLRNPLAEPGLLGISSGASLGAVVAIYFGFVAALPLAAPVFALVGAFVAAGIVLLLARTGGTLALILAGVAISGVSTALVMLALNLAPNPYAAYEIMTWLMGSLSDRSWDHLALALPFIVPGLALLLSTGRALDTLALGDVQAESLGVPVARTRLLALVGTALSVGTATATAGAIGFVGLMAPHVVRPLVGYQPGRALVPAMLAGALLVTLADIATRTVVLAGAPLNIGVFTSLIGTPFFLWLVMHVRSRTA